MRVEERRRWSFTGIITAQRDELADYSSWFSMFLFGHSTQLKTHGDQPLFFHFSFFVFNTDRAEIQFGPKRVLDIKNHMMFGEILDGR